MYQLTFSEANLLRLIGKNNSYSGGQDHIPNNLSDVPEDFKYLVPSKSAQKYMIESLAERGILVPYTLISDKDEWLEITELGAKIIKEIS